MKNIINDEIKLSNNSRISMDDTTALKIEHLKRELKGMLRSIFCIDMNTHSDRK